MTIKEIIMKTTENEVLETFEYYYGSQYLHKVKNLYLKLKEVPLKPNETNMIFFIRVLKENEQGDDVIIDDFDVNDTDLFFDVCGEDDEYDGIYSISSSDYSEILGYYVSSKTLNQFNFSQIIAHLLWEINW